MDGWAKKRFFFASWSPLVVPYSWDALGDLGWINFDEEDNILEGLQITLFCKDVKHIPSIT